MMQYIHLDYVFYNEDGTPITNEQHDALLDAIIEATEKLGMRCEGISQVKDEKRERR